MARLTMFEFLLFFVAFACLTSLAVFLILCFAAGVEALRDWRWQREYERELREAEAQLSEDLERWQWVELS